MNVIFTADDYGAFDEIDNAIISAVQDHRINSVAILPNGNKLESRIFKLQNAIPDDLQVELGCHLTFCTGKPVSKAVPSQNFMDGKFFKSFKKTQRAHINEREAELEFLKTEITAQINRIEDLCGRIDHITCHHNTLMWFEDYFDALLEKAKKKDGTPIPIRSPYFLPDNLFDTYTKLAIPFKNGFFFLRGNNTQESYKKWRQGYDELVPKKLKDTNVLNPTGTFTKHYGPAGGLRLKDGEIDFQVAQRKHPALTEFLTSGENGVFEVVFHLIQDDYSRRNKFRKKLKSHKKKKRWKQNRYPGINHGYVDGRMAEMRSLMSFSR
ncbi:MAG: ChbG/HpnK family deacetylase, partial [Bacteroidetes bacterium]|nr:ChbG/HpnK family deacetylase [Bacteroidota bacterium]